MDYEVTKFSHKSGCTQEVAGRGDEDLRDNFCEILKQY